MQIFLFHLLIAVLIQISINWIGRHSYRFGYANIAEMSEQFVAFNFLLRSVTAPVFVVIFSIALYQLPLSSILIQNIWTVSIYYAAINFLFALVTGGLTAVPFRASILYLAVHITSILLSYFIYRNYIGQGAENLLPTAENFRSELWLLILLFLYGIFNDIKFRSADSDPTHALGPRFIRLYKYYSNKYSSILRQEISSNQTFTIFIFSVAIYENLNRNWIARIFERIFFQFLKNKTTGLMQVHSKKPLTDKESFELAQEMFIERFIQLKNILENEDDIFLKFSGIRFLLRKYNTGDYASNINQIFEYLLVNLPLPNLTKDKITVLEQRAKFFDLRYRKSEALKAYIKIFKTETSNENFVKILKYVDKDESTFVPDEQIEKLILLQEWIRDSKAVNKERKAKMDKELDTKIFALEVISL